MEVYHLRRVRRGIDRLSEHWKHLNYTNMKDEDKTTQTPKLLYTNKHGNIYEGDVVECCDIVAFEVKITQETKLPTQKSIQTARVIGKIKSS